MLAVNSYAEKVNNYALAAPDNWPDNFMTDKTDGQRCPPTAARVCWLPDNGHGLVLAD